MHVLSKSDHHVHSQKHLAYGFIWYIIARKPLNVSS